MKLNEHPTVLSYQKKIAEFGKATAPLVIESAWLRQICLDAGADDAGFASIIAPELAPWRESIASLLPGVKSIVSLVCSLNPYNVRCASRATSDLEFLQGIHRVDASAGKVAALLREKGIRTVHPASGFPMDLEQWPEKMWKVSHKLTAVAGGLGRMGRHRLLIHPRFGSFVVLGSILLDAQVSPYGQVLDYDPCIGCGLCASVCPAGAVASDGSFGFSTCITHNYRDRLGGFTDWVERVVSSKSVLQYRRRVSDPETVSMWQGLTYGISNKCSYCMAVCPAGENLIGEFLDDRKTYTENVVKPLKDRKETIYVTPSSDGEAHARKNFPHKTVKLVGNGLRARTVRGFVNALPLFFNRDQAAGLVATYHFTFTGEEPLQATVIIRDKALSVLQGLTGEPDLRVTADGRVWLRCLAKEKNILLAILMGKIRVKGPLKLFKKFASCFPS